MGIVEALEDIARKGTSMSCPINVRIISKSEVESLLTPEDVIHAVQETFKALGEGQINHPVKEPMWMGEHNDNMLLAMPAHVKNKKVVGVKWVNMFAHQQEGIPSSYGNILILNHEENGQPYALMEASPITYMRTAGGHAVVAAQYLARKDSKVLAIIGCGEEGKAGARGFLAAFPGLKELRLCDTNPAALERMKEEFGNCVQVTFCANAQEAVETADMVLIVTTARVPLVKYAWLKQGSFVAGLHAFYDMDPDISQKADKWFFGSKETDFHQIIEAPFFKDFGLSMERVTGDLGEVATGQISGRENDDEIILYTHMGMGALDIMVGNMVYQRAIEQGIGKVIDLS